MSKDIRPPKRARRQEKCPTKSGIIDDGEQLGPSIGKKITKSIKGRPAAPNGGCPSGEDFGKWGPTMTKCIVVMENPKKGTPKKSVSIQEERGKKKKRKAVSTKRKFTLNVRVGHLLKSLSKALEDINISSD